MKNKINCVFFDLDGTLADTAEDLAYTLNTILKENNRDPLPFDIIRPHVSHGAGALIKLGFDSESDDEINKYRPRFLEIYSANIARHTVLFPGMPELLGELDKLNILWGIITNKPSWLTEPLINELGLSERAACIVSGDSTTNKKPHPDPMHFACDKIGVNPDQCIYLGDAERDIEAGNRSGMKTITALFGYIGDNERPETWNADGMINHPLEILKYI